MHPKIINELQCTDLKSTYNFANIDFSKSNVIFSKILKICDYQCHNEFLHQKFKALQAKSSLVSHFKWTLELVKNSSKTIHFKSTVLLKY